MKNKKIQNGKNRRHPGSEKSKGPSKRSKIIFSILLVFLLSVFALGSLAGCGILVSKAEHQTSQKMVSEVMEGYGGAVLSAPAARDSVSYDIVYDEGYAKEEYASEADTEVRYKTNMPYPEPMPPVPPMPDTEGEISYERKIIKTGRLNVEVKEYETAQIKAMNLADKYNGFVADSNTYTTQKDRKKGHVTIRIPSIHFDAALIEAGQLGNVKSQSVNGDDVTENYMDMQARLNNSQREEQRLYEVLEKAEDVDDILRVERELSRVRGEIERYQGRLNYLDNHVSMSTLNIEMFEPTPVVKSWGIWDAVKDSLNYALATVRFLIRLLGFIIPVAILIAVMTLLIVWRVRRKRNLKKR